MKALLFPGHSHLKSYASLLLAVASIGLVACSGSDRNSGRRIDFELNSRQFSVDEDLATVTFGNGAQREIKTNFGSGAFHSPADGGEIFYTVTDRGPSFDCAESLTFIGQSNFCNGGNSGTVFPLPNYAPRITKWQLSGIGTELSLTQLETIELNNGQGSKMTGLPNQQSQSSMETPYDANGLALQRDANGIDPEALVKLENGRFWVAEEYGPSLLLVAEDGQVLERQVPAGSAVDYPQIQTGIPVDESILPAALARRKIGGGIKALALAPSGDFLYYVMQSPLTGSNADSRVVRIGKLALADDGSITSLVGEYLYRLDPASSYANLQDGTGDLENGEYIPQAEITVNEAVAVADDYLVIVEQGRTVSKYYKVGLANAVSITGTVWETSTGSSAPENQFLIEDVPFVTKQLGFDSLSLPLPKGIDALNENIDGFAVLSANFTAVINGNNWGLPTATAPAAMVKILPLGAFVVASNAPARPSMNYTDSASFPVSGVIDIAADTTNSRIFAVDGVQLAVTAIDVSTPLSPQAAAATVDLSAAATDAGISLGAATSVATFSNFLAVALSNANPTAAGIVALYQLDDLSLVDTYQAGVGPVRVSFSLLGQEILVANEGQPSDDYSVDPEGSVTLIDFSAGVTAAEISQIDFTEFNVGESRAAELPDGVRVFGPGAEVSQDLEPQGITFSLDTSFAYITLQENNAVAVIDLAEKTIDRIMALGTKDFGLSGNELDVNDNGAVSLQTWPGVVGMYQPDEIGAYSYNGGRFLVTANEGQSRTYTGFNEEVRANTLVVDGNNPSAAAAADTGQLGRLLVSNAAGDTDNDGAVEEISAFGARSFSIWKDTGELVFDSGSDIARSTLALLGSTGFNDTDTASDSKGAEPKGLSLISSGGRVYAFLGLEATGGVLVYDISSPYGVQFVQYVNNRNFAGSGDRGPQEITGFTADGVGYIVVANTVSGNVRILEIDPNS